MVVTTAAVAIIGAVAIPLFGFLGLLVGTWSNRHELKNQQKALALKAQEASAKAAVDTRRAITADWEAYAQSMQEDRRLLLDRLAAVEDRAQAAERRLDTAEARAMLAEERAVHWESRYRIAVTHMRELIKWASDISHMGEMPTPPAELISDL